MSLKEIDRQVMITLELEKAEKTWGQMEVYIKPGIFTKDEGRMYSNLQKLREDGDYNCYIDVEKKDVEPFIEPTRQLIDKIKKYIADKKS